MKRFYRLVLSFLFLLSLSVAANATQVVVISPVPPTRNVVTVPVAYDKCYLVREGVYHGRWVPTHEVCHRYHYTRVFHRSVWVPGHWRCTHYNPYTHCCRGRYWVPEHWYR